MKLEIISGALIAALILFVGNIITLFAQDPDLTFGAVKQSAWVSIIGGAVLAFLKDYQAIATRQLVSKVTGRDTYTPTNTQGGTDANPTP